MTKNEQAYLDLIRYVRDHGTQKGDRTGTGTLSVFGAYKKFINEMFEKSMPVSFLNDIILLKDNSKLESVRK